MPNGSQENDPEEYAEKYETLDDEALLTKIVQKDSAAFETLYDRHSATVFGLLIRLLRNEALAEEILQESFWQIWKKAEQWQGRGAAAAWMYRIARNKGLDQLRRQKARPQVSETELEVVAQVRPDPDSDVEEEARRNLNRVHIQQALDQIPEEQRLCLELAYFEGMSQRQIAEHTQTPLGTIKTRVRMGMGRLERILRGVGYQEDEFG